MDFVVAEPHHTQEFHPTLYHQQDHNQHTRHYYPSPSPRSYTPQSSVSTSPFSQSSFHQTSAAERVLPEVGQTRCCKMYASIDSSFILHTFRLGIALIWPSFPRLGSCPGLSFTWAGKWHIEHFVVGVRPPRGEKFCEARPRRCAQRAYATWECYPVCSQPVTTRKTVHWSRDMCEFKRTVLSPFLRAASTRLHDLWRSSPLSSNISCRSHCHRLQLYGNWYRPQLGRWRRSSVLSSCSRWHRPDRGQWRICKDRMVKLVFNLWVWWAGKYFVTPNTSQQNV